MFLQQNKPAMAGFSVSKSGTSFIRGKSIDDTCSLRRSIIDSMVAEGRYPASGYFRGQFKEIADISSHESLRFKIIENFVKVEITYPEKSKSGNPSHLRREDVELIDFLEKKKKPSKT